MSVLGSPRGVRGASGSRWITLTGIAVLSIVASACGSAATQPPATQAASQAAASQAGASPAAASQAAVSGAVTVGSNQSDANPKAAYASLINSCASQVGVTATINTTDHGKFQDAISSYLQGTPDDVFTWFSGYRMQFFAAQGLATDISDVWAQIGSHFSDAMKAASTGADGKQYFVPIYNYPWVVIYRKSVFAAHSYQVPKTWDDFIALAAKMKTDGLIPVAFADKDGWPAMGTFDILDMRLNGYQFHVDLMAGKQKWTDPKVASVFTTWAKLLPYYQTGALGLTWQEAAQALVNKKAGMYFLGTFAGQQATPADIPDLDFFAFPTLGTSFDSESAIDAPIDGLMLSKAPKNLAGAKALLACVGTPAAENLYMKSDSNDVAAAKDADTSGYNDFQKKSAEIIGSSQKIAQFLDRDTRPDFAGPNGMQHFLQSWLSNPTQDSTTFLQSIQSFYDQLPPLQ
jgi:multiple sugar transport system substrate-binding protein